MNFLQNISCLTKSLNFFLVIITFEIRIPLLRNLILLTIYVSRCFEFNILGLFKYRV
jgi:hypothetical protein